MKFTTDAWPYILLSSFTMMILLFSVGQSSPSHPVYEIDARVPDFGKHNTCLEVNKVTLTQQFTSTINF